MWISVTASEDLIMKHLPQLFESRYKLRHFDGSFESADYSGQYGSFTLNSNKDYRATIARGADASSLYHADWFSGSSAKPVYAFLDYTEQPSGIYRYGYHSGNSWATPSTYQIAYDTSSVDAIALQKVKNRLSSVHESFKGLVPLGELKETMRLAHQANTVTTDFLKLALNMSGSRRSIHKKIANAWLTYGFGIRPVLSDLSQLCKAINDTIVKHPSNVRVHGSFSKQYFASQAIPDYQDALGITWSTSARHEINVGVRYSAGLRPAVHNSVDYSLMQHFGLTWGDVPSAVWELTPYSWLADYLTNIGDVINDAFWVPPGQTIYLCKTQLITDKITVERYVRSFPNGAYHSKWSTPSTWIIDRIICDRTPLASLPHASLRFRTQSELAYHGWNKVSNLVSVFLNQRH